MTDRESRFPMLGHGYSIPWAMIAPFEQQARENHRQSLQCLAERGGLGECEAVAVMERRQWHRMDPAEASRRMRELVAEYEAKEVVQLRAALARAEEQVRRLRNVFQQLVEQREGPSEWAKGILEADARTAAALADAAEEIP